MADQTETVDYDEATDGPPVEPAADLEPVETTEDDEADDSEVEDDEADSPNAEAAKYRRKLRATETERDHLAGQLEAIQRQGIEDVATSAGRFRTPAALWAGGVEIADLTDDDGTVDRDKVLAACDEIATRLEIARKPPAGYVKGEGANPSSKAKNSMVDVVMGNS